MQMIQLPNELAVLADVDNCLFVHYNGLLLLSSAFFGTTFSADYDIAGGKLNFNKKAKPHDIVQLVCPNLKARWVYQHDTQNAWKLIGKFSY